MGQQINMELTPPLGTADWHESDLPSARIRAALRAANGSFLELAGATSAHSASFGPVHRHLAAQRGTVVTREKVLAALPYALFDLRFRDEQFWRAAATGVIAVQDAAACAPPDRAAAAFTRVALFFVWHVADLCVPSASLVLGAPADIVRQIAALPIGGLEPLSYRLAPALTPRFVQRDHFWELLGECLRDPSAERLARLRLLGLQLAGMDSARRQQLQRRGR